jgi:hypothetical protein
MEGGHHHQRKCFIGGNWKCNGSVKFLSEMIEGTLNKVEYNQGCVGKLNIIN